MSKRNPLAKWVLPTEVHPEGIVCVTIPVPDEIQYRAAFWGALLDLASAYKWADDPDHTAKEVAAVWKDIIDELILTPCGFAYPIACGYAFAEAGELSWTFVPEFPQGSFTSGLGWIGEFFDSGSIDALYIQRAFTTPIIFTHLEFTYSSTGAGSGPNDSAIIWVDQGSGPYELQRIGLAAGGAVHVSWTGSLTNVVRVQISLNSGTSASDLVLFQAELDGFSSEVFECV